MDNQEYGKYRELVRKLTKGDERFEDLLHDILIQMNDNKVWNELSEEKRLYFLTKVISNQFYSNNSKFQRTYRKFNYEILEQYEEPEVPYQDTPSIEWVNNLLETEIRLNPQRWYDIGLFKLYMEHKRIEPIYRRTRIPKYSIRETIKQMKSWIKQKWIENGTD